MQLRNYIVANPFANHYDKPTGKRTHHVSRMHKNSYANVDLRIVHTKACN